MTDKTKQTIKDEISKLPREAREVVESLDWVKLCEEIGSQNNLNEDEVEGLQVETLLVIIGATSIDGLGVNIENQVELTREKSEDLEKELKQKIFKPLKERLDDKVKANLNNKKPDFEQNINFVLSGGNYAAFVDQDTKGGAKQAAPTNILDLKKINR